MNLDLPKIKNVHFIGIGGIGISAIARMFLLERKDVTGQDMQDSEIIHELTDAGAKIMIGQSFDNIPSDTELVVYTIAIENYDPELFQKLKEQKNFAIRSYPEMLGLVSEGKYTIAIAGTHGKTTTTGMIAKVLIENKKDPSVIIGSLMQPSKFDLGKHGTNFIAGKSDYFVVEACEYRRSFLNINPKVLVITNIDADHLDYYKDIEDIKNAFRELAMKVPPDGFVICDPSSEHMTDVIKDIKAKVVDSTEFYNENLKLKLPGIHNKQNASCAYTVGIILDIGKENIEKALENFAGTARRFEYKGELESGAKLYDDYAHHPHEITASLQGFRELYPKSDGWRITVVFQPHLFSRTKLLLKEFSESFSESDEILILPIYYAREENDGSISSNTLADLIVKNGYNAKAFNDFESAEEYLKNFNFTNQDIIVTMGAGEAFKVGDVLLNK